MKNILFQKDLITVDNLNRDNVHLIFEKAEEMEKLVGKRGGNDSLKGRIMAALFFEPSSRTFSSFITSMQRLGGGIIPLNGMANTSIAKGETLEDTAKVFSSYADIIVMRHPTGGAAGIAAKFAEIPVVNAGDGINEHPSQALIDLFTIKQAFKRLNNLHILMIGDLAHYRPTNSLAKLLVNYPGIKMSFATPEEVSLPDNVRKYLKEHNISFEEYNEFDNLLPKVDVLYVTRVKKEYMSEELYHKVQGSYVVDRKLISKMKKNSIIMHCLPRVGEIDSEIDGDPRSIFMTKQVRNGMYVRMAILDLILRNQ
ncbi:aspartate carbamoyltransferase [Patescibacteria group bacterium]|nr:aspartate carbamoyltransferase [Patescibacteria group bacterium]MCL5797626.1 aspartate carbamoyltransferase [Patescibacteria group bacterium]